jgi:hypothetical protein
MADGRSVPLEELSKSIYSTARAEQICLSKEVLQLAAEGLSEKQASVFWPTLEGASREECAALRGVPRGRWAFACTAPGPSYTAPARPDGGDQREDSRLTASK